MYPKDGNRPQAHVEHHSIRGLSTIPLPRRSTMVTKFAPLSWALYEQLPIFHSATISIHVVFEQLLSIDGGALPIQILLRLLYGSRMPFSKRSSKATPSVPLKGSEGGECISGIISPIPSMSSSVNCLAGELGRFSRPE